MGSVIDRDTLVKQIDQLLNTPLCVGVDVGKIHDPSAVCVSEVVQKDTGKLRQREPKGAYFTKQGEYVPADLGVEKVLKSFWIVRSIRRLPLGLSYPKQAIYLAELLCNPLLANRHVRLLMDVTGVGRPVYDSLKEEILLRKEAQHVQLKPVSFTHGETYNKNTGSLGKAYLVSRLQSLLQNERVHGPDIPEMVVTVEELRVYEIKVSNEGRDQYGAFKTGKHDDLATSLALSCLEDPYSDRVSYSKRVY